MTDPMRGPQELYIEPSVQEIDSDGTVTFFAPFFLAEGQVVAQAIIVPKDYPRCCRTSSVWWTELMGLHKPTICRLRNNKDIVSLSSMAEMGVDVTVVSRTESPQGWRMKLVGGRVTSIGRTAAAEQSIDNILIEGPDKCIVSVYH